MVRALVFFLVLVLVGLFALINWPTFSALSPLSLGFTTVQAPLGLIMLGFIAFLCVLFTVWVISLQAGSLMESLSTFLAVKIRVWPLGSLVYMLPEASRMSSMLVVACAPAIPQPRAVSSPSVRVSRPASLRCPLCSPRLVSIVPPRNPGAGERAAPSMRILGNGERGSDQEGWAMSARRNTLRVPRS